MATNNYQKNMSAAANKGLFFDLDHTLIRPKEGRLFPLDEHDWEFMPGVVETVKPFIEEGYIFCLISNQGGIAAGFQTIEEVERKLTNVLHVLGHQIGILPPHGQYHWFYCSSLEPTHPDRKPNPGMITGALEKLQIDPQWSIFVGDLNTDQEAASAAHIRDYFHITNFLQNQPKPQFPLYE